MVVNGRSCQVHVKINVEMRMKKWADGKMKINTFVRKMEKKWTVKLLKNIIIVGGKRNLGRCGGA